VIEILVYFDQVSDIHRIIAIEVDEFVAEFVELPV